MNSSEQCEVITPRGSPRHHRRPPGPLASASVRAMARVSAPARRRPHKDLPRRPVAVGRAHRHRPRKCPHHRPEAPPLAGRRSALAPGPHHRPRRRRSPLGLLEQAQALG